MNNYDLRKELFEHSYGIVKHYAFDMCHDDAQLVSMPNTRFLHAAGETGTHIVMLPDSDSEYWPSGANTVPYLFGKVNRFELLDTRADSVMAIVSNYPDAVWMYYDGDTLQGITSRQAIDIADTFTDEIRKQWENAA